MKLDLPTDQRKNDGLCFVVDRMRVKQEGVIYERGFKEGSPPPSPTPTPGKSWTRQAFLSCVKAMKIQMWVACGEVAVNECQLTVRFETLNKVFIREARQNRIALRKISLAADSA